VIEYTTLTFWSGGIIYQNVYPYDELLKGLGPADSPHALLGPAHGHARQGHRAEPEDVLVEQGSLYPACTASSRRDSAVEAHGQPAGEVLHVTARGRRQLTVETTKWEKLARAIAGILRPAEGEGKS
jgi:hypothetical protein